MDAPIGQSTLGEMFPIFIFIAIMLLIAIFCLRMAIVTSKAKKQRKNQLNALKQQGMTIATTFPHVNGLPIVENMLCEVLSYPDRLEFKSGTTCIKLAREKITDMCIKTDVEIQQHFVSSVGGAIGGAIMFGALGAVIGGRAKNKTTKSVTNYLIITYINSQGDAEFIGFDVTNSFFIASKLVAEFNKLNTTTGIHIEL